jgi:YbbR domain-containing protein
LADLASSLRGLLTENLGYKIVALLLALLLWFDVNTDEISVVEYAVPLRLAVGGHDMMVINTDEIPREVEVQFSGRGKELLRLDRQQLAIEEEVEGGDSDTVQVIIEPRDVRKPANLAVTAIAVSPSQITVVTDRLMEKTVPLQPIGMPISEEGYEVVDVIVEPRRVKVRGVTSEVRGIGSLALDLSQIRRVAGPLDIKMEIAVPESLRTVSVTPDSVRIRGRVVEVRDLANE